ncbi:MAG: PTS mannitol transporter subunit IIBC, partial [Enterococcus hulanensis]
VDDDDSFEESVQKSKSMKSEGKELLNKDSGQAANAVAANLNKVSFACDAGMGSSAMGATTFKKKLQKAGITDIEVKNYRIEDVPKDSDMVVVHQDLEERTRNAHPKMKIVTLKNYLQDPAIDELVNEIVEAKTKE